MLCKHCLDEHSTLGTSTSGRRLPRALASMVLLGVSVLFCYGLFFLIGRVLTGIAQTYYNSAP